jgi:1-acyl-sn-glycerol-3-phosphate acyltransferase
MRTAGQTRVHAPLAERYSPGRMALFRWYLGAYFARHFNAVRLAGDASIGDLGARTVFYSNHPAWWDPLLLMYTLGSAYPSLRVFGPMDAAALARYPILERLGVFAVETATARGAIEFVRGARGLLEHPGHALCVTAQGAMVDARRRPLTLKRGVAHLLARGIAERAVPIALEYSYWHEKRPEALLHIGAPVPAAGKSAGTVQTELEQALEHTMETLAGSAMARDAAAFRLLVAGVDRGVGGVPDLPSRLRRWLSGRRFDPAHEALAPRN